MAHRNRVRSSIAAWETGAVTPAEFNAFDEGQWKALGEWGGVFALEEALVLGGAGLVLAGDVTFENTSSVLFEGDVTFGNDVLLGTSGVDFTTIAGGGLIVESPSSFENDLTVENTADFVCLGDASFANDVLLGLDPTDTVTVGAELVVNEPATFSDLLDAQDATFHGDFASLGDTQIGTASPGADDLVVYADASFLSDVTFGEPVTFEELTFFEDTADFQGLVAHGLTELRGPTELGSASSDPVDVIGTMTLHEPLLVSGNGRVKMRAVIGPNSNASYTVADCNCIYVPTLSASPGRTYTISNSGAQNGDFFEVAIDGGTTSPGGSVTLSTADGDFTIVATAATPHPAFMKIVRVSGQWRMTQNYVKQP